MKSSLTSSDNYRGISLFNSICKVFDYTILDLCNDYFMTSDMQFGFKNKHSTNMCSLAYYEVINHYLCNHSNVYSCLLDASKAFDRVHYGKLFNILLYKKVPFVIIRLLLDAYIRQEARVIWNSCKSQYFRVKHGVKQGGVISPILFNLYIDRLLLCLQRSGLGCHISNTYMGALSYADVITLISPSLYGLNRMLDICNKFAIDNFIIFNSKKTICIKYGEDVRVSEQVFMNGRLLSWHSEVRHLGNFFNNRLCNSTDSNQKASHFIGQFKKLYSNFGYLQANVLSNLFKSYCCSFYGSFLWLYNSNGLKKCCTQWNKAIRKIFSLPYQSHRWLLGPLIGQYHISNQLIRRDIKCVYRMINCPNAIIRQCILNAYYNANSLIGYKLAYFRSSFGIDIFYCDIMSSMEKSKPNVLLDEQQAQVNCLYTLCQAKSSHLKINGLSNDEINYLIDFITTS